MKPVSAAIASGLTIWLCLSAAAEDSPFGAESDPMELSLQELANFKVSTVSKRDEALSGSAAAIYVITRDDMRRNGATSVAEALRMVPGVQVARNNAHEWSIGVRGFNTGNSNKLLVLIDGRSVYSPLFSGVFWNLRDVAVEDIDRIEVIRGPGATLWGANAVNGVINIITRQAVDAEGWTLRGEGGSEQRAEGLIRYGAPLGDDASFRLSARGVDRADGEREGKARDGYWMSWLQGRADWTPSDDDQLSFTGELLHGRIEQSRSSVTLSNPGAPFVTEHGDRLAASALARWEHRLSEDSDVAVQAWYEYSDFEFPTLFERRHTMDLDVQHGFALGERLRVLWGGGYRLNSDEVEGRGITFAFPEEQTFHQAQLFLQNQITLWPDQLVLTLGTKAGYNEFSDVEWQPSGRFAWTPNEWNTLWGAVSRAVRTPTRLEAELRQGALVLPPGFPPPFGDPSNPALFANEGSRLFNAEELLAYEAGYRMQPHHAFLIDVAGFYNRYEDLFTTEREAPRNVPASGGVPAYRLNPAVSSNGLRGYSYGGEAAVWWQVVEGFRLHAWYAYHRILLSRASGSTDTASRDQQNRSPRHQAYLRGAFDLPHDVHFDAIVRYVDRIRSGSLDAYAELDLRLAWRFLPDWEIAVIGQNLLRDHHDESSKLDATGVERSVRGQLSWRWSGY